MRTFMWLDEQVCACKMATGWNAPQGVENVHTLCAGKPESDDRGNNISVKRLGTSLDRYIERYIKKRIIIIKTGTHEHEGELLVICRIKHFN